MPNDVICLDPHCASSKCDTGMYCEQEVWNGRDARDELCNGIVCAERDGDYVTYTCRACGHESYELFDGVEQ